jgi:hypothetical protein
MNGNFSMWAYFGAFHSRPLNFMYAL